MRGIFFLAEKMIANFQILGRTFSAYLICALIGMFAAGGLALYFAKKKALETLDLLVTLLWAALGAFLGSHLLYGLVNYKYIILFFNQMPQIVSEGKVWEYLTAIFGGSVFYGGMLGGLLAGLLYAYKEKLPKEEYFDIAAFTIPFFHVFGRIGCFLSGCCYGIECFWGVTFHHSVIESANGVKRLPVQLIEAAGNLLLFVVILFLFQRGKERGRLIYVYLVSYGILRFVLEFFRGDTYRGIWLGLSTSQIISIITIITSTTILILRRKR